MFLSPTGFIFVHNPKAAGTTVRCQLEEQIPEGQSIKGYQVFADRVRDMAHVPLWLWKESNPEVWEAIGTNGIVITRHPYDRAVSSFIHAVRVFRDRNQPFPFETIGEFLKEAPTSDNELLAHAQPQHWFVCDRREAFVANILRLEDIEGAMVVVPGAEIDLTVRENDQEIQNPELSDGLKKLVLEAYEKDFELLGYEP